MNDNLGDANIAALIAWVKKNYAWKPGQDDEHIGQLIQELQELDASNAKNVAAHMAAVKRYRKAEEVTGKVRAVYDAWCERTVEKFEESTELLLSDISDALEQGQ